MRGFPLERNVELSSLLDLNPLEMVHNIFAPIERMASGVLRILLTCHSYGSLQHDEQAVRPARQLRQKVCLPPPTEKIIFLQKITEANTDLEGHWAQAHME